MRDVVWLEDDGKVVLRSSKSGILVCSVCHAGEEYHVMVGGSQPSRPNSRVLYRTLRSEGSM